MNRAARSIITAITMVFVATAFPPECAAGANFMGGLHLSTGLPQGEMDEQIGEEAYGIGGQFFYSPAASPFALGIDLSWANYGSETRREPFSHNIPDVTVDVESLNNFVQALFVLRGQVRTGPIQPYADALIGVNYLYTETSVNGEDFDDEVASSTNMDDAALAYGFGGGVMVPVWGGALNTDNVQQVLIDAGVRYIHGGEAEYLRKGGISRTRGNVKFDSVESRTDMVKLHMGVMLRF